MNNIDMHKETPATAPLLEIRQVTFSYGNGHVAVSNVSLDLKHGEFGSIIGPSGCGKSTLLRGIAGFEPVQTGSILMEGNPLSTQTDSIPPEKRDIGMMFQDYALFPHLSVAENIAFGLRRWSANERDRRVRRLLELIRLNDYGDRDPYSLSGGEQQRTALARAIAPKPKVLLMDEPFTSVDAILRQTVVPEMKDILSQEGISCILVTHNQELAFAVADRIGTMESGQVHQWGTPYSIYHSPVNRFTAKFVGESEFISATVINENTVESIFGKHRVDDEHRASVGEQVEILLRPDDVIHDDDSPLTGQVIKKSFRGAHYVYTIRLNDGQSVLCLADSHHDHHFGERVGIRPNIEHVVLFRADHPDAISSADLATSTITTLLD